MPLSVLRPRGARTGDEVLQLEETQPRDGEGVARSQHQSLIAPTPFDQHHVQALARLAHHGNVIFASAVFAGGGVQYVQTASPAARRRSPSRLPPGNIASSQPDGSRLRRRCRVQATQRRYPRPPIGRPNAWEPFTGDGCKGCASGEQVVDVGSDAQILAFPIHQLDEKVLSIAGIRLTGRNGFCRSKKGPPRRCKKGPLGGCGLVPVVHGRMTAALRAAISSMPIALNRSRNSLSMAEQKGTTSAV